MTLLYKYSARRQFGPTKQPPGTAGPGNMLGCCLVSFHFVWGKLSMRTVQCLPTFWFQGLCSHCIFCSVTFLWDLAQLEIRNSQKPLKHTLDLLCEVESKHILCKTFCLDILRCHQGEFLLPSSWKTTRTASEVLKFVSKVCGQLCDSRKQYIASVTISASANNFLSW